MQSDSIVYKFYYQWWKNIDKSIFLLISLLFVIGLFFSLVSTSLIASDKLDTNSYFFFFKHLIYLLIGISLIFIFSSLNSNQLYKYSIFLFFIIFSAIPGDPKEILFINCNSSADLSLYSSHINLLKSDLHNEFTKKEAHLDFIVSSIFPGLFEIINKYVSQPTSNYNSNN